MYAGIPHMVHVQVTNKTGDAISVRFEYDFGKRSEVLKNINPNNNKIAGVSTIYSVRELKMIVNEMSTEYLIKNEIEKGCFNKIEITINKVSDDTCEFNMLETDRYNLCE